MIRPTKNPNVPSGRPNVMYTVPGLFGTHDYLENVREEDVTVCEHECSYRSLYPCDLDVYDICLLIMGQQDIALPRTPYDGIDLFIQLKEKIWEAVND